MVGVSNVPPRLSTPGNRVEGHDDETVYLGVLWNILDRCRNDLRDRAGRDHRQDDGRLGRSGQFDAARRLGADGGHGESGRLRRHRLRRTRAAEMDGGQHPRKTDPAESGCLRGGDGRSRRLRPDGDRLSGASRDDLPQRGDVRLVRNAGASADVRQDGHASHRPAAQSVLAGLFRREDSGRPHLSGGTGREDDRRVEAGQAAGRRGAVGVVGFHRQRGEGPHRELEIRPDSRRRQNRKRRARHRAKARVVPRQDDRHGFAASEIHVSDHAGRAVQRR